MIKYKNIFLGWARKALDLFDLVDADLKKVADERIGICSGCEVRGRRFCSKKKSGKAVKDLVYEDEKRIKGEIYPGCGCDLTAKTLVSDEMCPLGKWDAS